MKKESLFEEHEVKKHLQAKVRESIYKEADKKRRMEKRTWVEVMEACLKAYVFGIVK